MAQSTIVSNATNLKKYLDLPQKGKVMAEYVWIDGSNGIRSKSKVSAPDLFLFGHPAFFCPLSLSSPVITWTVRAAQTTGIFCIHGCGCIGLPGWLQHGFCAHSALCVCVCVCGRNRRQSVDVV
ncbi:hypothetical protein LEMA_P015350.1 [Plenodomus lingam JN3]|uniref:GS beta-grasp domain-containing protein n=1 Tax=Leptosphaeria maculans (strain JN3 / isolate v23.1.3 / race Av1-4-5-6-7-8) TaxID=985895 RepID=E5A9R4_LEPMJ|nr:hypothetical protein LEMA_P015350.1 [Plenodomus lingam JN3]CBY00405.1 hypothetical protein LEMA_P015350.1 [Plenodomus lingam JN3]